ncbi:MAG: type IV toxin-antitoxin system AbiEi family antitoxin domain-containing protein [Anaerolineae bacterium]
MKRNLSEQEQVLLSKLAVRKAKLVTPHEVEEILGTPLENTYRILSRLYQKGWVERVRKGLYLIVPMEGVDGWAEHEFVYASRLVSPYYISYRTALSHWGLTEQLPRVVFIATTKRRHNFEFQGAFFRFVTVKSRKLFGFAPIVVDGIEVQMADREKAIVDSLDQEAYGGGILEISKALLEGKGELEVDRLGDYALRMGSQVLVRRLGYLLDLLDMGDTMALAGTLDHPPLAYLSTLFPKKSLTTDQKWRLLINVPERQLLPGREIL